MRFLFSILFSAIIFISCGKNEEALPIAEPELIKILADIHLAEAAFQNLSSSAKDTLAYQYYDQIYQIHEVEKELVDSCIAILNRNPERFYDTYAKVQDFLVEGAAENLKQQKPIPKKNR
jgi:hypothetical protein